jgi:predicted nuclease of restriction endonuclease-like (RecB) superfamily
MTDDGLIDVAPCPHCSAPEGCRTGAYYSGKWRERRSIDCYERQIKNLTEQLAELRKENATLERQVNIDTDLLAAKETDDAKRLRSLQEGPPDAN